MTKENFITVLKNNNLIETENCFLFFINNVIEKTSVKGNKYKLIETIDKNNNKKYFYYFNLSYKFQPLSNYFMYSQFSKLGDNWKIDEIYEIIKNPFDFNCSICMWNSQSVCNKCKNDSYYQKQEQENNNVIIPKMFIKTDFANEEELSDDTLVDVNDFFPKNKEVENFWKENDNKKED